MRIDLDHLIGASSLLTERQGHPPLTPGQIFQLDCMVNNENSISQMPTGSGKTYAGICLPDILLVLKHTFGYTDISDNPRVLYVVPLVAIMESVESQLVNLNVSYQILRGGTTSIVNNKVKVVVISPEKMIEKATLASIISLNWSAIVLDEPHLAVQWGLGNKKKGQFKKPFREAFAKLNRLNQTGAVFQLQTATAVKLPQLFSLLGKKDSLWKKENTAARERQPCVLFV